VTSATLGATRWTPDDAFISWVALQWDAETAMPVDAGVYVAEVDYDAVSGEVIGLVAQPIDPMVPTAFVEDFSEVWLPLVRTHDWSPDQTAIVYDTVDWELFTADTLTGDSFPFLTSASAASWPVWSPDGSKIAFQHQGGRGNIATINPDGTGEKLIVQDTPRKGAGTPFWSPTGEHVIYSFGGSIVLDDRHDIYRVTSKGGGKTNLTKDLDTRSSSGTPAWPAAWR
jgi:dipeptidyl aminopeptidase/acylaminoacyl peptidase